MTCRLLLTGAAMLALCGAAEAQTTGGAITLDLTPRMADGKVAHLDVRETITAPGLKAGEALLKAPIVQTMMPTALNAPDALVARDEAGAIPLTLKDDPVDPTQFKQDREWIVGRATIGDVKVEYRATPRVITPETRPGPLWDMRTEGTGFYGQGGIMLALPEWNWPRPVTLTWNLAEMPEGSRAATSLTEGPIDAVLPRDALTRSFLMAGPFHSSPADGKGAFVAYWLTQPVFDMEAAVDWTRKAYAYFETFWEQPNKPFRIFMRTTERFQGGGGGGYQSFIFGNVLGQDRDQQDLRELMAHEASHNFVGNLGTGQGQWYSEGANTYYTAVLIHRAGLTDVKRFGETMNDLARSYYLNPRSNLSNAEAQRLFFADGDAQVVPYQRGPLYFALVDSRMRAASGGQRRVDELVKTALTRKTEGGNDVALWTQVLREGLGQAGVDEFEAMMAGKTLALGSDLLGPCFRSEETVWRRYRLGFRAEEGKAGPTVARLEADSAAAKAGIANGDRILNPEILKGLDQRAPGPLTLRLLRGEEPFEASFSPAVVEKPGLKWVRTGAPDNACNI